MFPLQTVLFPGGWLPLRIFEVRYLDMVQRCHKVGAPFGVVCLTQGTEVMKPPQAKTAPPESSTEGEAFFPVGVLANIETLAQPHPGLLHIACRGSQRFRVKYANKLKHGVCALRRSLAIKVLFWEGKPRIRAPRPMAVAQRSSSTSTSPRQAR